MKKNALALLLSCIAPLASHAQTARLVKDINSTTNASAAASSPSGFIRFGSRVFFAASTPAAGRELWATDGTQAGTTQVADLRSGFAGSSPSRFVVVNDKLIFNASDSRGEELWMTDGTVAGTRLMADISPNSSSIPGDRIVYHGKMLFSAHEPVNGRELWITDGTPAGTRLFKDLQPGAMGSEPQSFVLMNDLVYFLAGDALWKTDGTAAGTVKVKDSVGAFALTVAGSRIFFNGNSAATGVEPWVSDGTEAGTHLIVDIAAGSGSSTYYQMTAFGDRVLFPASDSEHGTELWISDGTAAGTRMVRDINPGVSDSTNYPWIAMIGETAFFTATTPETGLELWKTDGTEAGTMLVRDIVPGSAGSSLAALTAVGSRIFFVNWNGSGSLLWMTDGTSAGTQRVRTTEPKVRPESSNATQFTSVGSDIYFSGANPLNGYEPWKTDGTDAGTSMIANLAGDPAPSSVPGNLTAAGDWIYFDAWDGLEVVGPNGNDPRSIWRSDGTPEGTVELTDSQPYLNDPWPVGRSMFFSQNDALWISDGTAAGTKPATEFGSRFPAKPHIHFVLGDTIMVSAAEKLWATKLASGTGAVSLDASPGFSYFDFAGRMFYFSQHILSGISLRSSDGTPAGTYTIAQDFGGFAYGGRKSAVMCGQLYFVNESKLWKSDGTFQGTVMVKSAPGAEGLVTAGRNIFYVTADDQLWVTDGTEAGTRALPPKPTGNVVVAVGDRVVFAASDSASGSELWVSDGTVEGTRLLRDIFPGATGSFPAELTSIAGVVYLTANDGLHGSEVWVTDGTAEGTKLAADVQPGMATSFPQDYVRAGEQVFFIATATDTGRELWALPLSSAPRLSIGDVRVAEGSSVGSAVVSARFTVTLSSASAQNVTVEYATSDATATGGSDYDAASGTLTFAAGQTSKQIEVQVRGDAIAEGNEAFFVTLRSPAGAVLEDTSAFAVIEDDDLTADVALTPDFSSLDHSSVFVNVANHGPGPATNLRGVATATPATVSASTCASCPTFPFHLQSGDSMRSYEYRSFGFQQYLTLTATARERDPVTSNNSIGWTKHDHMAMDALYLSPGSEANIWFSGFGLPSTVSIESLNPAVVSVPGSMTVPAPARPVSFVARGLAVGTATIRVFTPSGTVGTLQVDVVAPGTKPRWPGALEIFQDEYTVRFDEEANFRIYRPGTAPFTGHTATGLVTIKANGREVGQVTLTPTSSSGSGSLKVSHYAADIGSNQITADYGGDENFLPQSISWNVVSTRGAVTILAGSVERNATTARIRINVTGSPMATPTGTISVGEPGVIPSTPAILTATTTEGVAQADVTLTNMTSGEHTLVITYAGDTYYLPATQNMRIVDERRRSVRH